MEIYFYGTQYILINAEKKDLFIGELEEVFEKVMAQLAVQKGYTAREFKRKIDQVINDWDEETEVGDEGHD